MNRTLTMPRTKMNQMTKPIKKKPRIMRSPGTIFHLTRRIKMRMKMMMTTTVRDLSLTMKLLKMRTTLVCLTNSFRIASLEGTRCQMTWIQLYRLLESLMGFLARRRSRKYAKRHRRRANTGKTQIMV